MHSMCFKLYATPGTAYMIKNSGYPVEVVEKAEDGHAQIVDLIRDGKIQLVLNTPLGPQTHMDGVAIRAAAIAMNVPLLTTLSAAMAAVSAIQALRKKEFRYRSFQNHFQTNPDPQ